MFSLFFFNKKAQDNVLWIITTMVLVVLVLISMFVLYGDKYGHVIKGTSCEGNDGILQKECDPKISEELRAFSDYKKGLKCCISNGFDEDIWNLTVSGGLTKQVIVNNKMSYTRTSNPNYNYKEDGIKIASKNEYGNIYVKMGDQDITSRSSINVPKGSPVKIDFFNSWYDSAFLSGTNDYSGTYCVIETIKNDIVIKEDPFSCNDEFRSHHIALSSSEENIKLIYKVYKDKASYDADKTKFKDEHSLEIIFGDSKCSGLSKTKCNEEKYCEYDDTLNKCVDIICKGLSDSACETKKSCVYDFMQILGAQKCISCKDAKCGVFGTDECHNNKCEMDCEVKDDKCIESTSTCTNPLEISQEVKTFWTERNSVGAKLFKDDGSPSVHPALLYSYYLAIQQYEAEFPEHKVYVFRSYSGTREDAKYPTHKIADGDKYSLALDLVIKNAENKELKNFDSNEGTYAEQISFIKDTFYYYGRLHAYAEIARKYYFPKENSIRWGAGFSTTDAQMDLMHGDIYPGGTKYFSWSEGINQNHARTFGIEHNLILGETNEIITLGNQIYSTVPPYTKRIEFKKESDSIVYKPFVIDISSSEQNNFVALNFCPLPAST